MDKINLKNTISKDIGKGINSLEKLINQNDENDLFVLNSRYIELQKNKRNGVMSQESFSVQRTKLVRDCLDFIDSCENLNHNKSEYSQFANTPVLKLKPRLEIELEMRGSWLKRGLLIIDNSIPESDGSIHYRKAKFMYEVFWNFNLIIRNNSSFTAFYPEIEIKDINFNKLDELKRAESILAHKKVELEGEVSLQFEGTESEILRYRDDNSFYNIFSSGSILLKYENESGQKIITDYKYTDDGEINTIFFQN